MTIQQRLAYNHWANKRLYAQLFSQNVSREAPEAIQVFIEMLYNQKLWCDRIDGLDSVDETQAIIDLGSSEWLWLENKKRLESYALKTSEMISYIDDYDQKRESSIADILFEVLQQGAYHRGQIAAYMKGQGLSEPPLQLSDYQNTLERRSD